MLSSVTALSSLRGICCGQAGTEQGCGRGGTSLLKVLQRTSHNRFYNRLE